MKAEEAGRGGPKLRASSFGFKSMVERLQSLRHSAAPHSFTKRKVISILQHQAVLTSVDGTQ